KLAFTDPAIAVTLQGTDRWRDAYFEIPDVKFLGVNQGPQAAARFLVRNGQVHFSRLRYAVIRPCGPDAGANLLESCKPPVFTSIRHENDSIIFEWTGNAILQEAQVVLGPWNTLTNATSPQSVLIGTDRQKFYRLQP